MATGGIGRWLFALFALWILTSTPALIIVLMFGGWIAALVTTAALIGLTWALGRAAFRRLREARRTTSSP